MEQPNSGVEFPGLQRRNPTDLSRQILAGFLTCLSYTRPGISSRCQFTKLEIPEVQFPERKRPESFIISPNSEILEREIPVGIPECP